MKAICLDGEAIADSLRDPSRFAVVFDRHFASIHAYLRRRVDAQLADELSSQTFLIAFDARAGYDCGHENARPWLFGIATNLLRNHRRREVRELRARAAMDCSAVAEAPEGVEERLDALRMRSRLAEALAGLPAEEADVLLLIVWAELGYAEVSESLAIPMGTVKSRFSRARQRLRDRLAAEDPTASTNKEELT